MWTTSNSPVRRLQVGVLLLLASSACRPIADTLGRPPAPNAAPDAPRQRQAVDQAEQTKMRTSAGYRDQLRPVELRSVTVRRLTDTDEGLKRLAGRAFLAVAHDPLVIEVVTERELGRLDRTSSPEIFLNGKRVGDTWAVDATRLVTFLADRRRLKERNSITVAWLGNEELTRTRRALTFMLQEVR